MPLEFHLKFLNLILQKKNMATLETELTIAIVDTGVDFSNPDIQHSLARNEIIIH